MSRIAGAIRATNSARPLAPKIFPRLSAQLQPEPLGAPRWPFKDIVVQAEGVPRAGPFNQTQQLVGFAEVKNPGNDDGPADRLIRVEHSPVPHSETSCVLHHPFQVLDLPGRNSCIAIHRLACSRPDRRIESLQVLDRTANVSNSSLQRRSSRFSSSFPRKRPASISSYASPRRR